MISGIRATSDGLKAFKGPSSVPITKQLQLGRSAHAHYTMRLEKERKEEARDQFILQREQALQMKAQKRQLIKEKKDL